MVKMVMFATTVGFFIAGCTRGIDNICDSTYFLTILIAFQARGIYWEELYRKNAEAQRKEIETLRELLNESSNTSN